MKSSLSRVAGMVFLLIILANFISSSGPIINSVPHLSIYEGTELRYRVEAKDPNGGPIEFFLTIDSGWLSINHQDGLITGIAPEINADTDYQFVALVSDSNGVSSTIQGLITVKNTPPGVVQIPNFQIDEGLIFGYQIILTGSSGSPYDFYLTQDSGWLIIENKNGIIRGTAPSVNSNVDYGVAVLVVDKNGATTTQGFTITVKNVQPVIPPSPSSDTNAPIVSITFPLNIEYDSNITTLNYTAVDLEGNLNLCWYSINLGVTNSTAVTCSGSFSITSTDGINRWTVYASDLAGNVGSNLITFSVEEEDDDDNDSNKKVKFVYEDPDTNRYETQTIGGIQPTIDLITPKIPEKGFFSGLTEAIMNFFRWLFS